MSTPLQAAREAAGLTKAGLARRAGVNERTVRNLEQGVYHPSVATLHKLASALNVPIGDLLEDPCST